LFGHGSAYLGHIAGTFGCSGKIASVMLSGEAQKFWGIITHVYLSHHREKAIKPFREFIGQVHLLIENCPFSPRDDQSKVFISAIQRKCNYFAHHFSQRIPLDVDQNLAAAVSGKAKLE
jgi:hypothetical protein